MLKIQEIPQRDLDSLALLSNLADDDYSRLAGAFHAAKPCLQILIDALNRAKAKAEELSEFVTRGGLPYLEP